ncbi:MAG: conjugal transfer protein TraF [Candidatus Cloacimonetes bacterium]|nr:conjugal transfer protein TraF [Candidatus Cloacimonadota bacterium]
MRIFEIRNQKSEVRDQKLEVNAYLRLFIILTVFLVPCILFPNFVSMNYGARSMAMGSSYTALVDDPTAIFINPAGLSKTKRISLALSHQNLYGITDLYNEMAAISVPIPYSTIGLGYTTINLLDVYAESIFHFSAASKVNILNYPLNFGFTLKYFMTQVNGYDISNFTQTVLPAETPSGFGFDLGLLFDVNKDLSLGLSGHNLNEPKFSFISEEDKLMWNFSAGICYNWRNSVNFLADYVWNSDDSHCNLGGEMWFYNVFAARIGVKGDRLTAGFGLKTKIWSLDGAVLSNNELGSTYRISLGWKFGRKK